jgi:hypothetical protein
MASAVRVIEETRRYFAARMSSDCFITAMRAEPSSKACIASPRSIRMGTAERGGPQRPSTDGRTLTPTRAGTGPRAGLNSAASGLGVPRLPGTTNPFSQIVIS